MELARISIRQIVLTFLFIGLPETISSNDQQNDGIFRETCSLRKGQRFQPMSRQKERLQALRKEMISRVSVEGDGIEAYILPPYDNHQNEEVAEHDRRLQYLTGFTGSYGFAVVTLYRAAFWTDDRFLRRANGELPCDWDIFPLAGNSSITHWILKNVRKNVRIGSDPHLVPHFLWTQWERDLFIGSVYLHKINHNLIDAIWSDQQPPEHNHHVFVHHIKYAGEEWESKIDTLRSHMTEHSLDSIVITSLTEIAYILNLRGNDLPFIPVFKAYLVVTQDEILLFCDHNLSSDVKMHLKTSYCHHTICVHTYKYNYVFTRLLTSAQKWKKVLLPGPFVFELGASEAIHSVIPLEKIIIGASPVIFMKAEKNAVERKNMRMAHIRDGAAMCDGLHYIEKRFLENNKLSELEIQTEIDRSRMLVEESNSLSLTTIVAFGKHSSYPTYVPSNVTDVTVTDESLFIISSGSQYPEGTTEVTRTLHFGEPTKEQKEAYTSVLSGIIRLAMLKFPDDLKISEVDTLSRSSIWETMDDYPHSTGHGIGSFLSLYESPIDISHNQDQKYNFKPGNFFSNEPGYYKKGSFGIRLQNVLEVKDTGRSHPSGSHFLRFEDITLVPYEAKFIDRALLKPQEKRWLNNYNAKIRELVGGELKAQLKVDAYNWMMNKTLHVREYLPKEEYQKFNRASKDHFSKTIVLRIIGIITFIVLYL